MAGLVLKERDLMKGLQFTMTVRVKRDWRVNVGLFLMRCGLRLAGASYVVKEEC